MEAQRILAYKHLGWTALRECAGIIIRLLLRGQTNFLRMLWKFSNVYHPELQLADHRQPVNTKLACRRRRYHRETRRALYPRSTRARRPSDRSPHGRIRRCNAHGRRGVTNRDQRLSVAGSARDGRMFVRRVGRMRDLSASARLERAHTTAVSVSSMTSGGLGFP